MKKNVCGPDKAIRYIGGITLILMYYTDIISKGIWGTTTLVAGLYLILSGFFGYCIFNALFGFDTCRLRKP